MRRYFISLTVVLLYHAFKARILFPQNVQECVEEVSLQSDLGQHCLYYWSYPLRTSLYTHH